MECLNIIITFNDKNYYKGVKNRQIVDYVKCEIMYFNCLLNISLSGVPGSGASAADKITMTKRNLIQNI